MAWITKAFYVALFASGIYFLKQYMYGAICDSKARMDGKVVIITGANTGIGKETAKDLVQRGAKVYLACRSLERAQLAVEDIVKTTGVSADRLPVLRLDLGSLKSVRQFVGEFKRKETKLDVLINNAGVMFVPQGTTEDGFETTFGVNHLGHFLLTNLLIDLLLATSKSRVVTVSSMGHTFGVINFDDIMLEKSWGRMSSYAQSKLANILFTRELAKRLKDTGVTAYSLHPGTVRTELQREFPFFDTTIGSFLYNVLTWPLMKDPWAGAQTTICCTVDENLANDSGKYYSDCAEKEPSKEAQDDESARKLWDVSVQLVKLDPKEIHPKLQLH